MDNTTNSLNWFEIPVIDLKRAKRFYEAIFEISMEEMTMGDDLMAFFPWTPGSGKATGSLVQGSMHKPSMEGVVIYLNGNPNLQLALDRVEAAGGKIAVPKMSIAEHGNIAFLVDTEGNKIGLHSTT